ncbi:MAG TPA: ThiF family adenylyltransferase [Candidatus Ozemobacteraceae bacterium]|nr:ThiF family adenylyltransferase [Candidatus Ozemobacteraceae bacterium]HQG27338.1 ThiF family adenylyltransferase [Candidatus Ozemobacteraceae bacterium]
MPKRTGFSSRPHIIVTDAALRAIRETSALHPATECGGLLLGIRRGDTWVVAVATGPGNTARMSYAQFSPDIEFARAQLRYFGARYGYEYLGEWHKHPAGMMCPSGTDRRQAAEIIRQEGLEYGFLAVIAAPMSENRSVLGVQAFLMDSPDEAFRQVVYGVHPSAIPQEPPPEISRAYLDETLLGNLRPGVTECVVRGRFDQASGTAHFGSGLEGELSAKIVASGAAGNEADIDLDAFDLIMIVDPAGNVRAYQFCDAAPREVPLRLYDPARDVFRRNGGLASTAVLPGKHVVMIGVGSVGSQAALEFARAGVGRLTLVDPDRLEPENVCRHACSLADLGRFKVDAVAERVRRIKPDCVVDARPLDVMNERELLEELFDEADLVFVSTDTNGSRGLVNELAWQAGVPSVYVSLLERADRGYCQRIIPGTTPCRWCLNGDQPDVPTGEFAYTAVESERDVYIQPGLSTDIGIVTLLGVRMALDTLTPGTGFPYDLVFWNNRSRETGEPGFSFVPRLEARAGCPVCGTGLSQAVPVGSLPLSELVTVSDTVFPDDLEPEELPAGEAEIGAEKEQTA